MIYTPIDILRKFVVRKCIQHLIETSENAVWVNLTFWENVTNKAYAANCWHKLSKALVKQYPGFRLVGVWARQGRGAWHIHAVCDRRVDVNWLRCKAQRAGFGPQMYLAEVRRDKDTPERLARYITGYVTDKNGLDKVRDKGVRRTIFVGNNVKVVNMRFKSGLKAVTAIGRELALEIASDEFRDMSVVEREMQGIAGKKRPSETWGEWYKRMRGYWFDVGWASLSSEEQYELFELDEFVRRYIVDGRWSYV
jgi:hypothetical protein